MNGGKCMAAIEPGIYDSFTGYVNYAGTEGWVENASFELIEAFDYNTLMPGFKFGAVAPVSSLPVPEGRRREVRISDGPYIEWHEGFWLDGVWANGVWHDGQWIDGTWKHGVWRNGDWHGGTWENGIWYGGRFLGGTFLEGLSLGADGTMAARIWNRH